MPFAPAIACPCGGRRRAGESCSRCGRGGRAARREHQRAHDQQRGNAAQRGYDWQWSKFAKQFLRLNPLCAFCDERGIVTAASEVHHPVKLRERPDLKYETTNLAAACKVCHSKLTAQGQ